MIELGGFDTRRPAQLSGGQQQRVAVARALIFEPEVVLMDEPLGALDKQLREQMQYEIKLLHQRLGVTIVYVTHDQSEALTMSDRIAVFNDGEIQQLSTPSELYEQPSTSFVAEFIGENNRLSGTVEHVDSAAQCVVRLGRGQLVRASAVGALSPGQPTLLSIRPERVQLNPSNADGALSILEATIDDLVYLGDHIRVRLLVSGQEPFVVKLPNNGSDILLHKGHTTSVGWYAKDCRALNQARATRQHGIAGARHA
jgi:putative spermidine/putrescine transport system ATP-binding protein